MTVEEKLDWILKKVKDGNFYPYEQSNKPNKFYQLIHELYGVTMSKDRQEFSRCEHEWFQLVNVLFENDKLIEENTYKYWVLTVKGQMFEGYVNRKIKEGILMDKAVRNEYMISRGAVFAAIFT